MNNLVQMSIENLRDSDLTSNQYKRVMRSNEKEQPKYMQMPMQFSDKFFDEDPGLIKIV